MAMQMQQLRQKLQQITMQKETAQTEKQEIERALDELEDDDADSELYKSVGTILISKDHEELREELEEEKDDLEVRLKSLERKEDQIKEQVQDAQENFAKQVQGGDGGMAR